MAEPFSIGAGVVSVIVPAIHGLRLLLQDIENIKDAPKSIKNLNEALSSVQAGVSLLQNVNEKEWTILGEAIAIEAQRTIASCTEACEHFRTNLGTWTRLSNEGKLHWRDRTKIGVFKQGQIKAMTVQMQNCQQAIISIVSIANLYNSVRHSHMTEEVRSAVTTRQTEITQAITRAQRETDILQNKVEELEDESDDEMGDSSDQAEARSDKAETLRAIAEAQEALNASRKLLEELLIKGKEAEVAKAAKSDGTVYNTSFGANNTGFQANVIYGGVTGLTFGGIKP